MLYNNVCVYISIKGETPNEAQVPVC